MKELELKEDLSKRYWLVMYDGYYPDGFDGDVKNTFDTLEELNQYYIELSYKYDYGYIFDREENKLYELHN